MSTTNRSVRASANSTYDPTKPFNVRIREMIVSTHNAHYAFAITEEGKRFKTTINPKFVEEHFRQRANDGIGTKALLHYQMRTEHHGAKDAFCMVADDLIEGGFVPVSFEDHIMIQEEDTERIFRIVSALVELAKQNRMAIVAGETAIINTLQGFEVGISGEGYAEKGHQIGKYARPRDVVIGIESDLLHSNGYTFVRNTLLRRYDLDCQAPWGDRTVGEDLTVPTRLYLPAISDLLRMTALKDKLEQRSESSIHGMVSHNRRRIIETQGAMPLCRY